MSKGIFIEGLKKPKECSRRCPFADDENYDCTLNPYAYQLNDFKEQYMDCPLEEKELVGYAVAVKKGEREYLVSEIYESALDAAIAINYTDFVADHRLAPCGMPIDIKCQVVAIFK